MAAVSTRREDPTFTERRWFTDHFLIDWLLSKPGMLMAYSFVDQSFDMAGAMVWKSKSGKILSFCFRGPSLRRIYRRLAPATELLPDTCGGSGSERDAAGRKP